MDPLVSEHSVGDPLLGSIDDPVFAILSLGSGGLKTKDVTSGVSFGDGETDEFLSSKDIGNDLCLELIGAKVEDRWESDDFTAHETVAVATISASNKFLCDDQLVEVVELFGSDESVHEFASFEMFSGTHSHGVHVDISHLVEDILARAFSVSATRGCVWYYIGVDEFANCFLENAMSLKRGSMRELDEVLAEHTSV